MAISLDQWLLAVSFLVVAKIQIRCLTDMHALHMTPTLQIVRFKNGYEAYSPNYYQPCKIRIKQFH